jgi:hypothetical protein
MTPHRSNNTVRFRTALWDTELTARLTQANHEAILTPTNFRNDKTTQRLVKPASNDHRERLAE